MAVQKGLVAESFETPVTAIICFAASLLFFVFAGARVPHSAVGMSYSSVVRDGQYWRVFTSAFAHVSLLHLLFNATSLWSLRLLELSHGSMWYLHQSLGILLLSSLFHFLLLWFSVRMRWRDTTTFSTYCVGYSGVVFGMMSLLSTERSGFAIEFIGIPIPALLSPFFSLLVTHIIVPRASLFGHLGGILAGYIAGSGAFDVIDPAVTFHLLPWIVLGVLAHVKRDAVIPVPFFDSQPIHQLMFVEHDGSPVQVVSVQ